MYIYAQIDKTNKVISISTLSNEVVSEELIPLQNHDVSLLGCIYDKNTHSFVPDDTNPNTEEPREIELLTNQIEEQKSLMNAILGVDE